MTVVQCNGSIGVLSTFRVHIVLIFQCPIFSGFFFANLSMLVIVCIVTMDGLQQWLRNVMTKPSEPNFFIHFSFFHKYDS